MKELKIEARVKNLDKVLAFVNAELETLDCLAKTKKQLCIATEEIFVNIAHYAYISFWKASAN
jgi:anti-sigma regulatory factor (Ser/Thr protein kinase)